MAHRIREAWQDNQGPFARPVEVDETYIGGKEGNKHWDKKRNAGRGPAGKAAVLGMRDCDTNKVVAAPVGNKTKPVLQGFVTSQADLDATIYTDEHSSYEGLANHASVKHSLGEYVRGQAHTNGVESFWSMLKRGYYGTYHRMSPPHLQRYVTEFSGRHNQRPHDTLEQMQAVVRGLCGKNLPYKQLASSAPAQPEESCRPT